MHLTARPSRFAFLYAVVGVQHRNVDTSGIYSEQVQIKPTSSPTPTWRKHDPVPRQHYVDQIG